MCLSSVAIADIAAKLGHVVCFELLFASLGLAKFDIDKQVAESPVYTPMQLAWKWGCGAAVEHLERLGFGEAFCHNSAAAPELQKHGLQLLKENYVDALISAGTNPNRGSDMQWILSQVDDDPDMNIQACEHRANDHDDMSLHRAESIRLVIMRLIFEQQFDGLRSLMAAVQLHTLELWDDWVNFVVVLSICRSAPGVRLIMIENGSLSLANLASLADLAIEEPAIIFHGTPVNAGDKIDGAPKRGARTTRELMRQSAHSETTWNICGVDRLMTHLKTDAGSASTSVFTSDESDDAHQWTLTFRARGDKLCLFLRYCGRKTVDYDLASPPVTCSVNITAAVNKRNLPDGSAQVQLEQFVFAKEQEIAAFDGMSALTAPLEVRLLDFFVMELTEHDANLASWRFVGLNTSMDDEVVLFSPTFQCGGSYRVLSMHISEAIIEDKAVFMVTPAMIFGTEALEHRINDCFMEFEARKFRVMKFSPELTSVGRKYVHSVASVKGMQHTTHTINNKREVWAYKPVSSQGDGPIDVFVKTVDSRDTCDVAPLHVRVEVQSENAGTEKCVGHMAGIGGSYGCAELFRVSDLSRGDRSEVVYVKLIACDANLPESGSVLALDGGEATSLTGQNVGWALQQLGIQSGLGKFAQASRVGLLGRPAATPDNVLKLMAEHMVLKKAKPGEKLTTKGEVVTEYVLVADGECHFESLTSGVTRELDTFPAAVELDLFLYGMQSVHSETVVAASACSLYVLPRKRLLEVRATAPRSVFPPASYHTIGLENSRPVGTKAASRITKAVVAASIGDSTKGAHYIWRLYHPKQLFAKPMDGCPTASRWFSVASTPLAQWRLLLIPHTVDGDDGVENGLRRRLQGRAVTLCIGCRGYKGLRSGQLTNGSFRLCCSRPTATGVATGAV